MDNQELILETLLKEYSKAKAKNPMFSQRAFAMRLGLSSGATSSILSGKRRVSKKMAQKILERMAINPLEKHRILNTFQKGQTHAHEDLIPKKSIKERKLSLDQFEALADPIHFALLSLIELQEDDQSSLFMAKRLGKSTKAIRLALKRLKRLDLIDKDHCPKGHKIKTTGVQLASPDEIQSSSIKNHHIMSIEEAKESLFKDDIEERDFTSQTLSLAKEKLPDAKRLIRKFGEDFEKLLSEDEGDEVYKINVQLFPLSRRLQ